MIAATAASGSVARSQGWGVLGGVGRGVHQAVLAEIVERRGNTVEASKKLVRERNRRDSDLECACPAEIFARPQATLSVRRN